MIKILSRYTKTSNGYVKLYLSNGKVVEEHRFIIEQNIGRKLKRTEEVHHIDKNRQNNTLSNLEIKDKLEHLKEHKKYNNKF